MKDKEVNPSHNRATAWLWLLGGLAALCYLAVQFLSWQFHFDRGYAERPILPVLGLLLAASVCYLWALFGIFKIHRTRENEFIKNEAPDKRLLYIVLFFALVHRLLLLPSQPIEEIDFYRYLWDGHVLLSGTNPFRYSPEQIDRWSQSREHHEQLHALWQTAHSSETMQTIFERVHHRHVPTVYPPAAQVVFALSAFLTPAQGPLWVHALVLKIILVCFDVGTVILLIGILRLLRWPLYWCLAYAWCPLVLKEIANSAHLDVIAVFFTTLCIFTLLVLWKKSARENRRLSLLLGCAGAASLAIGVLAKSYPIILFPVVVGFLLGKLRWRALIPGAVFVLVLVLGYLPFAQVPGSNESERNSQVARIDEPHTPLTGLKVFLTQWEMNDFLFMLVHENLRQPYTEKDRFFVLVPRTVRQALHDVSARALVSAGISSPRISASFVLTQFLMGLIVASLSIFWAVRLFRRPEALLLLRGVFLVLVWGWLLSAAQNPWYVTWCLPFMVFAGRRSWFLLPVMAFLYYLRFWLQYSAWPRMDDVNRLLELFDYGIVWLEYLPFFILLSLETCFSWQKSGMIAWTPAQPNIEGERVKPASKATGKRKTHKGGRSRKDNGNRRLAS